MTYADIALVQDILAFRILIEKVIRSLHGSGPLDTDVVDRLAARLSGSKGARRSLSRRIHPDIDGMDRLPAALPEIRDGDQVEATQDSNLEGDAVPLLRELSSRKLDENEINKLVELLSKVDRVLDSNRTRAARSRYL